VRVEDALTELGVRFDDGVIADALKMRATPGQGRKKSKRTRARMRQRWLSRCDATLASGLDRHSTRKRDGDEEPRRIRSRPEPAYVIAQGTGDFSASLP